MSTTFMHSAEDRDHYLGFVQKALEIETYPQFESLLKNELRAFFPFGSIITGFGYITAEKTVQAHKLISIDFPVEYLNAIATPDGGFTSPKMSAWMQTRVPQLFEDHPDSWDDVPQVWVEILRRYGIRNVAAHGVHDFRGRCTSYFAFANLSETLGQRHCAILNMVVPMLHALLAKVIDDVPYLGIEPLLHFEQYSPREMELLQWVAKGAAQKEIASELGISESTVRNVLSNLYKKLGVNRAIEAVERARAIGVIE